MSRSLLLCLACAPLCLLVLSGMAGCQKGPDPAVVAEHRGRLIMEEEPDELSTVGELREQLSGTAEEPASSEEPAADALTEVSAPTTPTDGQVVLVGRVGGLTNPWAETQPAYPFVPGEAAFFLADAGAVAEQEASGHSHAPGEECPFCAAHAGDNTTLLAMVRFSKSGSDKAVPITADQLFDLQPLDTVVVRGKPRLVGDAADGMLVIEADGLYIRR